MRMDRRKLVSLGVALVFAPLAAHPQPAGKMYRIGILERISPALNAANFEAFRQGLRELGYVEGNNLAIEYRSAEGRSERFPSLAAELVGLKVDLILTRGTPAVIAAKNATDRIPIVMAASGDPIGPGVVPSLSRPGGNITGLTAITVDVAGKRLELLRQLAPHAGRMGALLNMSNPAIVPEWKELEVASRRLDIELQLSDVRTLEDLVLAFEGARRQQVGAFVVGIDDLTQMHRRIIVDLAAKHRLPAIYASREFVEAGGLITYGVSYPHLYRRAATYVDKILKGGKPGDLPIEQPTHFDLVINLKSARALGVSIPASLLLRADQVIE
jgi:putative tryptophan/tyrosine transport system substrate-binding protein